MRFVIICFSCCEGIAGEGRQSCVEMLSYKCNVRVVLRCCLTNVILPPSPLSSIPVKLETFPNFAECLADNPPVLRLETLAVFSHDISNSLAVPVVAAR